MTEIELPHEEERKVYCPNMCPFSGTYWDTPCIFNKDLVEPKIIEGRNFVCDKDKTPTIEEISNVINSNLKSTQKMEGVIIQPGYVQTFFSNNCCPLWAMRQIYGDDWMMTFNSCKVEGGSAVYILHDHLADINTKIQNKINEVIINDTSSIF